MSNILGFSPFTLYILLIAVLLPLLPITVLLDHEVLVCHVI